MQQAVRSKRIDLRKVLGDENPADLLTKHSLSQERIGKLVELFGCRFRDGRAEIAPKMRAGASNKARIAEADGDVQAVAQEEICTQPRMPHVDFNAADLDLQYPSLHAPEELELDDLTKLEDEQLYHAGMKVVQKVLPQ